MTGAEEENLLSGLLLSSLFYAKTCHKSQASFTKVVMRGHDQNDKHIPLPPEIQPIMTKTN